MRRLGSSAARRAAVAAGGFTLFEVAVSLAICAMAVTACALLFPIGVKTQLNARFQLYASIKAIETIDRFASLHTVNSDMDAEAPQPWDVAVGYRSLAPDLELRQSSHTFGIIPLPSAIAGRLDSEGDEIRRILDDGGRLYYSIPRDPSLFAAINSGSARPDLTPNDLQKLVFAVTGYAQDNALQMLPWKAWPYTDLYPSPPMHGWHLDEDLPAGAAKFSFFNSAQLYLMEDLIDPTDTNIHVAFSASDSTGRAVGYKPYGIDCWPNAPTEAAAIGYLQAALWYCQAQGLPPTFWKPTAPSAATALGDFSAGGGVEPHLQARAMRVLANAALCLTRWHTVAELGGSPSGATGLPIASITINGTASPAIDLTHDLIVWYCDSCTALAMRYAAESPYDWGSPRPLERALMTDVPLIEWDLFSTPLSGTISGSAVTARQWRPIPASPIRHIGRSWSFPDRDLDIAWGDPAHFTLCDAFQPEERCRQLVFWAVDWQGYEDCETCPSAPVDASKYPIPQPLVGLTFEQRMDANNFCDPLLYAYRNPEKALAFHRDVSGRDTGASVVDAIDNKYTSVDESWDRGVANADKFSGLYGADRNANQRLDRGPLPPSARMRAQLVGRFNYYDPRLYLQLR